MPTRFNFLGENARIKSPGLSRRKSLLTRWSSSRIVHELKGGGGFTGNERLGVPTCVDFITSESDPRLPMEMVDEIIKSYFDSVMASSIIGRDSQRMVFSRNIKPLTLVSRDIRYLILRQFCRNLSFLTLRDTNELFVYLTSVATSLQLRNWTGGFTWVRFVLITRYMLLSVSTQRIYLGLCQCQRFSFQEPSLSSSKSRTCKTSLSTVRIVSSHLKLQPYPSSLTHSRKKTTSYPIYVLLS